MNTCKVWTSLWTRNTKDIGYLYMRLHIITLYKNCKFQSNKTMSVKNRRQPVKQQSINIIKNIFSHKGMHVKLLYCVWQWCGRCQPGIFINTVWFQTFIRILLGNAMSSFINNHQRLVLPNSWSCMFHSNEQLCIWFDLHNKQWWPADVTGHRFISQYIRA